MVKVIKTDTRLSRIALTGVLLLAGTALVLAQSPSPDLSNTPMQAAEPPLLVPPPPPVLDPNFDTYANPQNAFAPDDMDDDDFGEDGAPLSIIEVPLLEVLPPESELPALRTMRIGHFSLLQKVTAKVQKLELRMDEPMQIGDLNFTMRDCISAPPEEPPETKVFLQVDEFIKGREETLFRGWMFASSPGIHALEHPVYDIWPLACRTEDGFAFTGEIETPNGAGTQDGSSLQRNPANVFSAGQGNGSAAN